MNKENDVLFATFFDKHEFEIVRDVLSKAGIQFRASNRAPSVNYKVPGSAFAEIELRVKEEDLEKAEAAISDQHNG